MKNKMVVLAVAALFPVYGAIFVAPAMAAEAKAEAKGTVDPRSGKPCYECHRSKITGDYVHDALADRECTPCHTVSAGNHHKDLKLFAVKDTSAKLCFQCHDDNSKAKSVHPVIDADGCLACHAKHNSPWKNLLKRDPKGLCFECHDKGMVEQKETTKATSFRDGKENLHFVHAGKNGIACLACHDVHASSQLHLIAPKGKNGKDAVTVTYSGSDKGGNCTTSCHDAIGYERK